MITSPNIDFATFDRAKIRYTEPSLPNDSPAKMTTRAVDIDVGNNTVGSDGWIAPYDCDADLSASLGMANLEGRVEVRLYKNGSIVDNGFDVGTASTHDPRSSINEMYRLSAGDEITLWGYAQRNSGTSSIPIASSQQSIRVIARL